MTTITQQVDDMLYGYLVCAVWTGLDYDLDSSSPPPLDRRFDVDDIADEAREAMRADVAAFFEANRADLDEYAELRQHQPHEGTVWEHAGHDFWLTRNHHGCGFFDRGLSALGDRLTQAAQVYGESDLYVGDDGRLWV